MALRGLAGDMARSTAGIWKAVADAVDPAPPRPAPKPAPAPAPASEAEPEATIDIEAGQMLVPIDAWTRILEQVGHVHEAGQQLADARERAARAETENEFLKEQLREIKSRGRSPRPQAEPVAPASPAEPVASTESPRLRRVRVVASRWISPS